MVVTEDTVEAEQEGDNMIQGDLIMVGGKRRPVNFMERIYNVMFNKKPLSSRRNNERLLELLKPTRYKPDNVEQMARETKFTKEEVKCLYRAFKQECPTAILDEETFKEVYQKIFPLGESSKYAKLVFNTIDSVRTVFQECEAA